ncbi:MAG: hypothetical protein RQM90_14660 [Methanoculleus sp.]
MATGKLQIPRDAQPPAHGSPDELTGINPRILLPVAEQKAEGQPHPETNPQEDSRIPWGVFDRERGYCCRHRCDQSCG